MLQKQFFLVNNNFESALASQRDFMQFYSKNVYNEKNYRVYKLLDIVRFKKKKKKMQTTCGNTA